MCEFCTGEKVIPLVKQHPDSEDAVMKYDGYHALAVDSGHKKLALFWCGYCPICGEKLANRKTSAG